EHNKTSCVFVSIFKCSIFSILAFIVAGIKRRIMKPTTKEDNYINVMTEELLRQTIRQRMGDSMI
ncbi:MAG: hypothetical protein ACJ71R_13945, partial [Nitrososphaeraceae archaeon]